MYPYPFLIFYDTRVGRAPDTANFIIPREPPSCQYISLQFLYISGGKCLKETSRSYGILRLYTSENHLSRRFLDFFDDGDRSFLSSVERRKKSSILHLYTAKRISRPSLSRCGFFPKASAYDSLPCVRGGGIFVENDGGTVPCRSKEYKYARKEPAYVKTHINLHKSKNGRGLSAVLSREAFGPFLYRSPASSQKEERKRMRRSVRASSARAAASPAE